MNSGTDIAREFTDVLTEVLAESAVGPARRGRLARARASVKKHPECSEHAYLARDDIGSGSGGKSDNDVHRPRRISIRPCDR